MMRNNNRIGLTGLAFALILIGCRGEVPMDRPHQDGAFIPVEPTDGSAKQAFPPAYRDHFAEIDGKVDGDKYEPLKNLSELEIQGRDAWMLWTGGNEMFWDWLSKNGYGSIDLLKVIDSNNREDRFRRAGLINEPGMRAPTDAETAASYGIRYDRPTEDYYKSNPECDSPPDPNVYGYPTGVLGLRIFKNPEFHESPRARSRWEQNKDRFYSEKPEDKAFASNPSTIKPYIVGMSCAICHVSHHPLNPPVDPENPEWKNISSTIGAQYLRIRSIFGNTLEKDSYLYHVIDSQLPGTVDTSLIATDNINNSNTMNAIFDLKSRMNRALYNPPETLSAESYGPPGDRYPGLWSSNNEYVQNGDYPAAFAPFIEKLERNPRHVPRVLLDGSDSLGPWIALARVYLNIGTYHQQWMRTHNTILGFRPQEPFTLADCEANSVYWHATKIRVDSMTAYFLKSTDPMLLKDAIVNNEPVEKFPEMSATNPGFTGEPTDEALKTARQVFAKGCIACHSSKQPDYKENLTDDSSFDVNAPKARTLDISDLWRLTHGDGKLPDDYTRWAQWAVESKSFWKDNYLSTDRRLPITMVGTNSARAMATNAKHDHVWEDFASNTFKDLDSVGSIDYRDPFSGAQNSYLASSGGPGYYRVPTLISAWATAPFFHNNALGKFNNDPSVKGRLDAFDDAIHKLLWPEKRTENIHDLAKLNSRDVRSPEDLESDGGLIWRTSERTDFKINGHQIPSLIAGLTGFTRFWVRLIPWIPSLILLLVGVYLFLGIRRKLIFDWLENRNPRIKFVFMLFRAITVVILLILGGGVSFLLYKQFSTLRMVEVGSGWDFPWITAQVALIALILFVVAILFLFKRLQDSKIAGLIFVLVAVVFAFGFGRFAAGLGGDVALGPFPKGMPVNLVVHLHPDAPLPDLLNAVHALTDHFSKHGDGEMSHDQELLDFEQNVAPLMMKVSKCPDLVLDRGHDFKFIQQLTDDEKSALISLIKTF